MSQIAFKRAWESYLHYLNIKAGGRDASRTRPKLRVIDNLTPHMLRRTYATILHNAGVDVKSAQRFWAMRILKLPSRHLSAQREQEAVAALNRHLNKM